MEVKIMNELKQAVIKKLNENGINSRQVSISVRMADCEQVIRATIHDPEISEKVVYTLLKEFRNVQYDHSGSGEILSGGNTFVRVHKPEIELTVPDDFREKMNRERNFTYKKCRVVFDKDFGSVDIYDNDEIIRMIPVGLNHVTEKAWYVIHELLLERRFWDNLKKTKDEN